MKEGKNFQESKELLNKKRVRQDSIDTVKYDDVTPVVSDSDTMSINDNKRSRSSTPDRDILKKEQKKGKLINILKYNIKTSSNETTFNTSNNITKNKENDKKDNQINNIENKVTEENVETQNEDDNTVTLFNKYDDVTKLNDIQLKIQNDTNLTVEEKNNELVIILLHKIKSSIPQLRKPALKLLIDKAKEFGPSIIFNQLLLLFSSPIDPRERHELVKTMDKLFLKLNYLVRPFVNRILNQISPMLLDEYYYTRVEGKEIISNLAKAAGLPTMLSSIKENIENEDEHIRTLTSKSLAVVTSALGVLPLIPFIKAICNSKKSWAARLLGIKTIQQIAILQGNSILPYLSIFTEITEQCITDENNKVRTYSALAIASLAESAYPFGIDSFTGIVKHLLDGISNSRSKTLAAFIKAMGFIIPLMDNIRAGKYITLCMPILKREFSSNDEEIKRVVMSVLKQCCKSPGVDAKYIREEVLYEFISSFFDRRTATDKRNYKLCTNTTIELSNKVGTGDIIRYIIDKLQDEGLLLRKMTVDVIYEITKRNGLEDLDSKLEEPLVDGLLLNFQAYDNEEQGNKIIICIAEVLKGLKYKAKKYIQQVIGIIKWRFNNKSARIRMYAIDLISSIASIVSDCGFDSQLLDLYKTLNEYIGEEYPEVLGSVIHALKVSIENIKQDRLDPPLKELLPKISPILKNQHVKVQENILKLIGKIAEDGPENASAKEWMRICFDLIEILKSNKKLIRRNAIITFGFIAKAIGPQDVLLSLLNNLKVQERQYRVCSTIAIAVISETCGPFTVIPALLNEYRFNELNVQNGVLKSISFLFENIGEMSKDYIYSVITLIEHALTERDPVHRQFACNAIKHIAIGVYGHNCEDALIHLLNFIWPNIFEDTPHLITSIYEAIDGLRIGLGVGVILPYIIQGLFHPAKRIRTVYWKIYNILYVGNCEGVASYCSKYTNKSEYITDNMIRKEDSEVKVFNEMDLFI